MQHKILKIGYLFLLLSVVFFSIKISTAGIRDHTRPVSSGTRVSQSQAGDLSLTLVTTAPQNLQTWLRLAAVTDQSKKNLLAKICNTDASLVKLKQRVRAFPADSISSIYQARISQLNKRNNCLQIRAKLATKMLKHNSNFVMEIIVQRGQFLAIPKEAIIEEGDHQVVYVQQKDRSFIPKTIHTGLQGELYTQVLHGLNNGDKVATFGSFFIDAQYKLTRGKPADKTGSAHAHHHH